MADGVPSPPYHRAGSAAVLVRADARALPLAAESVDLIVTSPPYWQQRSYTDGGRHYSGQIGDEPTPGEYINNLILCTREWARVLKPTGSIFVNLCDKYNSASGEFQPLRDWPAKTAFQLPERYRIACVDRLKLIQRAVVIWDKTNGLPDSATDRVSRTHEDWVHLTRRPRYYQALDTIREPYRGQQGGTKTTAYGAGRHGRDASTLRSRAVNPLGAPPRSVWAISTEPLAVPDHLGVDHFAAFPTEWPRRIVLGWSPPGGTVLDPCGGTGTTALVAEALGRHGISCDRSADYCRLARWRTTDPGQRAKARGVPKPPPVAAGQIALLADAEVTGA